MATHPSVLAWRTLGTGEPGGLLSMGSEMTESKTSFSISRKLWNTGLSGPERHLIPS